MPVEEPNLLTPTGNPGEERIDAWKQWLASKTSSCSIVPDETDVVMILRAASDHIVIELDIHADSLLRQAQSPEYGCMQIVGGDEALKEGRKVDWTNMSMEAIEKLEREQAFDINQTAKLEIDWLTKQIGRLEGMMKRAKENPERFRDFGFSSKFEPEERWDGE